MATGVQAVTTSLSRDEQLRGRQHVRHALRNLTPEISVFHNPKLNLAEMNDLYDRPLDIVLFHRTKGLLGIAIKSGEIVEESGDLVSQYQPAKEYYKIIDPIKHVQKAMLALLDECDVTFKDFVPFNVAVVFPDTNRADFSQPSALFMFQENLGSEHLQKEIEELFVENWDNEKAQKYRTQATRLKEFLKSHSDNDIQRVERKETLTKLGVREEKKAYHLPQKTTTKTGATVKKPDGNVRVQPKVTAPVTKEAPRSAPVQRMNAAPVSKQPVILKPAVKIEKAAGQVSGFLKNVENNIREHEQVHVTSGQWGMMIAIAAIVICVAYFIGRNAGIVMHVR